MNIGQLDNVLSPFKSSTTSTLSFACVRSHDTANPLQDLLLPANMSKKSSKRSDRVTTTKRDDVRSLPVSVASSQNRTISIPKRSSSASQPRTPLSTRSIEKHDRAKKISMQEDVKLEIEPLNPQTLYQQDNDLLFVGTWSQPQDKDEQRQSPSYWHGDSMEPCQRHSSIAEATWVPGQQLPPYERWMLEDIHDGSVSTLRRDEQSYIECTCMPHLSI
ncbi:hypothetical protein VTL71DRAFT_10289 [Oculimacula yallundae]|uniref:Uncharacterized protein n=1 Tax=Oculimacula yallundae TaxID=86028 RepID=A0ABR4CSN5_9HELO